ncbi:MAG: hypothetical protein QG639_467 [Patescibacteria group bacterium]|nr:hypothetical protein [Patescibacteria group bacterium]
MDMSTLDFLYISLGVGFLTLVGFLCYLITKAADTLDKALNIIENLENTTDSVRNLKDSIKSSSLRLVSKILKGGGYASREY